MMYVPPRTRLTDPNADEDYVAMMVSIASAEHADLRHRARLVRAAAIDACILARRTRQLTRELSSRRRVSRDPEPAFA